MERNSSILRRRRPDVIAPTGQTSLHFPQRMHSGVLISLVTSTAIGQDRSHKADRGARYLKYLVLLLMVVLLPAVAAAKTGIALPFFCKYICPAGTLEGGIPLLIADEGLRSVAGQRTSSFPAHKKENVAS